MVRILLGAAILFHGAYLLSNSWSAGNWLEVRASEPLRTAVAALLIVAGGGLAAGFYPRVAAVAAAPFYYWAALWGAISAEPEAFKASLNGAVFLALALFGVAGSSRFVLNDWVASRSRQSAGQSPQGSPA